MENDPQIAKLTLAQLRSDYERAGSWLRRKDASPDKPSPLVTIDDVLAIASKELCRAVALLDEVDIEPSTEWADARSNLKARIHGQT